jgi:hypothetical protein
METYLNADTVSARENGVAMSEKLTRLLFFKQICIVFALTGILPLSMYAQANTECKILNPKYSIKSRWNIKASYSIYNQSGFSDKSNIRLELNYGFNSCLEAGIYGGTQFFHSYKIMDEIMESKTGIAPTFGVQMNFHLLPLFVQNSNSRWELYLTAKYGGILFTYEGGNATLFDGTPIYIPKASVYKHEYCMGVGGGVYFWNVFGLYSEIGLGEFNTIQYHNYISPWTEKLKNFKLRGGLTFKF